ncbi:MAG TPA: aspartate kinase [Firmicutes bacterium]|jgi:aspartate kinase|nr:aspartate kinase [Bacillota bacterium]
MGIVVQKFGGTSVASEESRARVVAKIVEARQDGKDVVVVVSAMGRKPAPYATDTLLDLVESLCKTLPARERDAIAACGEIISTVVVAAALEAAGCPAASLTGVQAGISTDSNFTDARITKIEPRRILEILESGRVAVVAGFQGTTEAGDVTTLGRGGSDTTAAALGAALGAEMVEIYTDVEGIMTADPRVVPEARFQDTMSYTDLIEMANQGAKVVHLRAVEIAMHSRIPLAIKSTFSDSPGTLVADVARRAVATFAPPRVVSAVTTVSERTQLVLSGDAYGDTGSVLGVFSTLADQRISVDMINVFPDRIAFIVASREAADAVATMKQLGIDAEANPSCAKVSVVGEGMRGVPGVMAKVARALHDAGVRVLQTSDSHYSISCLVPEADMERAARALHSQFELEK